MEGAGYETGRSDVGSDSGEGAVGFYSQYLLALCGQFLRWVRLRDGVWVHPKNLGRDDVEAWLSELANGRYWVSANTQNVALQSLCFLYREVLCRPIERVNALRAKRPETVREVASVEDVAAMFAELRGVGLLAAQLIYGCGMRIGDVVNLRIKDLSFDRRQIHLRDGKGAKDRLVCFPEVLHAKVRRQIDSVRAIWKDDQRQGLAGVSLPSGWGRKSPSSRMDFAWWYLFASESYSRCPRSNELLRHHRDSSHLARLIKRAVAKAGIDKRITSHCLRHSYATHSAEMGVPLHVLQKLLGHTDLRTTERYIHSTVEGVTSAKSPLESLLANPQRSVKLRSESNDMPALRIERAG